MIMLVGILRTGRMGRFVCHRSKIPKLSQVFLWRPIVLKTNITFAGQALTAICDFKCERACGKHARPTAKLSSGDAHYAFFSDGELGAAPDEPGTEEGGCRKPDHPVRHNRCVPVNANDVTLSALEKRSCLKI
jgi:hypothetical protein